MHGVSAREEGAASGLVNVSQQVGGSLGLAVMVTIFEAAASRRAAEHAPAGVSAFRETQLEMARGTSAALTGSTVFVACSLLVILTMVRARKGTAVRGRTPERILQDEDGLESLSSPL